VGLATVVALLVAGVAHTAALISFGLCAFVLATIALEFWKGSRAIQAKEKIALPHAAFELTWRNTRRYGGYLVHMGIVLMFIGFTGSAFNQRDTRNLGINQIARFGHYDLKLTNVTDGQTDDYEYSQASIDVMQNGQIIDELQPEIRVYKASNQQSSLVGIRRRLNEDMQINFSGVLPDGSKATFQLYLLPLVSWIWIGFVVVLGGTIVCLIPSKVRLHYARTEVVGVASVLQKVQS
jgi:cytochrome c-type biogenesis protein CcmF